MCVGLSHFTAISWRCFVVNESTVAQKALVIVGNQQCQIVCFIALV